MKPSIQQLRKYFRLESDRNYDNHAVIGGLERILDSWIPAARLDNLPEDLIQLIEQRLKDYGRLTDKSRAETLKGLWKRIQRGDNEAPEEIDNLPAVTTDAPPTLAEVEPGTPEMVEDRPNLSSGENLSVMPDNQRVIPVDGDSPVQTRTQSEVISHPPKPLETPANLPPAVNPQALSAALTTIQGVGPKYGAALEKLGLYTLRDLLYYFPRRYDDYSQLRPINRLSYGETVTVIGTIKNLTTRPIHAGKHTITEAVVGDGTGTLRVTWFNQKYASQRLSVDTQISLSGKVKQYLGRPVMDNPDWELLEDDHLHTNRIVPIYGLSHGIKIKWLRRLIHTVVTYWGVRVPDPLPSDLRQAANLIGLPTALVQAHLPDNWEMLKAAQKRLAFDEIFLLQLGVQSQKRTWQEQTARIFEIDDQWLQDQTRRLPFKLTGAQSRVVADLRRDLASGHPMNRLIQGDVGSGKTVVAALAIAMVKGNDAQAALMAPTAILAEQHYRSLLRLLADEPARSADQSVSLQQLELPGSLAHPSENTATATADTGSLNQFSIDQNSEAANDDLEVSQIRPEAMEEVLPVPANPAELPSNEWSAEAPPDDLPLAPAPLLPNEIRLMVGATSETEKLEIRAGLADGSIKLIIGTHALIEDPVIFKELQLVIIDEQHRFGVEQRAALRTKGNNPHLLVMTATPIPRSLALTIYGDLDLSIIDQMPPGRQPVDTYVVLPRERERAYALIRSQVEQGRQAFIIYPLVEGNDESQDKAAVDQHARIQNEIFPDLSIGLLHGRLRPDEKDAVMAEFHGGRYHVLVSTTVIEVGVDVPNASVMLIESANRFGLAQLHQLRGRVGRSAEKSFCLLIPEHPDEAENQRLQVMATTTDGFVLAEKDLEQRGPGQFLGTRQAGYAELQFANLTDVRLIENARRFAQTLFKDDPELSRPEHQLLAFALQQSWSGGKGDIS